MRESEGVREYGREEDGGRREGGGREGGTDGRRLYVCVRGTPGMLAAFDCFGAMRTVHACLDRETESTHTHTHTHAHSSVSLEGVHVFVCVCVLIPVNETYKDIGLVCTPVNETYKDIGYRSRLLVY